jgi:HK97 family phage portal protein
MGLFSRIAHRVSGAGTPSYGMIPPLGSVRSATGLLVSQATAMGVSTVYACVRRRAIDVARCAPSLYRVNPDNSRTVVTDHPVAQLFKRPNREQNWFEFIEQMQVALLLRGNAYAAILRDGRGRPKELVPINPDAVMVLETSTTDVFYNVNRIGLWQIAMLRDLPIAIPEEDMLHLRGLNFNSLVGVSTIGLARDAIGLTMGFEQQAARWMNNGARPAGFLESAKMLSEDAAKRLKTSFNESHAGIQNTGGTAVLEDGVTWKSATLTSVDLEFLPQRINQVLEICRFFQVPPHKVYVVDRAAAMNIPQQDQDYVNSTVAPDLERWEYKLRQVFDLDRQVENDDQGIFVDFDESRLLRADILTRRNAARLGILSSVTTPNEERQAEGLRRMGGGRADELQYPTNTAAAGSDVTGTAADGGGRPPGGLPPAPSVSTGGSGGAMTDSSQEDAAATAAHPGGSLRVVA